MLPGHLGEHLRAIDENPDAGMIVSSAAAIDAEGETIAAEVVEPGGLKSLNRRFEAGELVRELATRNPLRCSAITLRNEALESVGGFDERYRYVVDWDVWLKIARRFPVVWRSEKTVLFRWHGASETQRFKSGTVDLEETERLLETVWKEDSALLETPNRLRKEGRRRLARAYLNRAYDAAHAGNNAALTRRSLKKAIALSPLILGRICIDPRLAWRLGAAFARNIGTVRRRGESDDFEEFFG